MDNEQTLDQIQQWGAEGIDYMEQVGFGISRNEWQRSQSRYYLEDTGYAENSAGEIEFKITLEINPDDIISAELTTSATIDTSENFEAMASWRRRDEFDWSKIHNETGVGAILGDYVITIPQHSMVFYLESGQDVSQITRRIDMIANLFDKLGEMVDEFVEDQEARLSDLEGGD